MAVAIPARIATCGPVALAEWPVDTLSTVLAH